MVIFKAHNSIEPTDKSHLVDLHLNYIFKVIWIMSHTHDVVKLNIKLVCQIRGRHRKEATRGDLDELELHHISFQKDGELSYPTLPYAAIFDTWGRKGVKNSNLKILKNRDFQKFSRYLDRRFFVDPFWTAA